MNVQRESPFGTRRNTSLIAIFFGLEEGRRVGDNRSYSHQLIREQKDPGPRAEKAQKGTRSPSSSGAEQSKIKRLQVTWQAKMDPGGKRIIHAAGYSVTVLYCMPGRTSKEHASSSVNFRGPAGTPTVWYDRRL